MHANDISITASMSLNEVIARYPVTLPVFAAAGMDACCGGALSIEEAARRHGCDGGVLLADLERAARGGRDAA